MIWLFDFNSVWLMSFYFMLLLYWTWFWDGARDSTVRGHDDKHLPAEQDWSGGWKLTRWFAKDIWHAIKRMSVYPLHIVFTVMLIHPALWIGCFLLIPIFHLGVRKIGKKNWGSDWLKKLKIKS